MRSLILISLICMCQLSLLGQSSEEKVINMKPSISGIEELPDGEERSSNVNQAERGLTENSSRGNWNMTVGTSYSYMKGYGSGMGFFAAPTYTLPLNNRWALHGGMIATQYTGINRTFAGETGLPNSLSSFALFAAASYRMNERLVFHGTGVKNLMSAPASAFTPYPMDNLSLGATYKLGNNISIGATIHLNNGQGYYATPFGGHSYLSPIFW